MERRIGYFAFTGAAIGAIVGFLIAAPGGGALAGLAMGALAGVFLGWFVSVAVEQPSRGRSDRDTNAQ